MSDSGSVSARDGEENRAWMRSEMRQDASEFNRHVTRDPRQWATSVLILVRSYQSVSTMVAAQATTKWTFRGRNLPVDTITVYRPSGAQIVRKLDLDLKVSVLECTLKVSENLIVCAR